MTQVNGNSEPKTLDEKVLLPYSYLQKLPGKNNRTKFTSAFNYWLRLSDKDLHAVGDVVQTLHVSTLLIDDMQDNSVLRRGKPVAHHVYGLGLTINASTHGMIMAFQKALDLNHPNVMQVMIEQILELHRGQGIEIYWRDVNFRCPTEEEYFSMTIQKTGATYMLLIRLMQLFSQNKSDFTKLAHKLSLYFQIRDDYCNLYSREYSDSKSFCDDITEGKFGFPIIHAIQTNSAVGEKIMDILRQRTQDVEIKKYCISLLEDIGSFKYTRDTLEKLDNEVREEMEKLGGNPILETLLDEMRTWRLGDKATDLDAVFIH